MTSKGNRKSLARRLFTGAAWALLARSIGAVSALVVNGLLARMLTPGEMGTYFLLVSIVMFSAVLARYGLKQTVVKLVAESMARSLPGRARATLKIVYFIVALGIIVIGSTYYLGVGDWLARTIFDAPILNSVTVLTIMWIAVLAFRTPVAETFRGLQDIRMAVFLDGVIPNVLFALALLVVWVIARELTFHGAVILSVATAAATLVFGTILLGRRIRDIRGEGSLGMREVVKISSPIFVANIATQLIMNYSLWVAGAFLVVHEVALYGAAWKLMTLVALPLTMVNMSVQPVIAELHTRKENQRLQNALRGTATLAGLPALAVLVMFIFFGEEVLGLAYGAQYREAAFVLALLSLGQLVNVWSGSCGMVLIFTGHEKQFMLLTVLTGFMSVAIAIYAVQRWGLVGIAGAVVVERALTNIVAWALVRRLTGLWTHATLSPAFVLDAWRRVRRR